MSLASFYCCECFVVVLLLLHYVQFKTVRQYCVLKSFPSTGVVSRFSSPAVAKPDHDACLEQSSNFPSNYDEAMSCNMECSIIPSLSDRTKMGLEDFARAPSPGMDINWQMGDDLLWGHLNGYGDTAECIPDDVIVLETRNANSNNNNTFKYRGVQARGWH